MTTIDFNRALQDARGASFEALPIGDYDVEVTKTESVTSSSGKPMIKVTFSVTSGPYEKRKILNQFVFSAENPQAVAIFFRHMRAFGLTDEWFASLGQQQTLEPVASALLGRRARVSLGHREWQGETRNEVKSVKPYTGAPPVAGPTGPGAFPGGPTPPATVAGPAPLPPTPPASPVAPPPPVASTPPAPTAVAPPPPPPSVPTPAPVAAPVQTMPQPPAPVPTPQPEPGYEVAASPIAPPTVATSDVPVAAPAPPALPV